MREFLFKAKRCDTSEWVEGYLSGPFGIYKGYEISDIHDVTGIKVDVKPYSICQFTGLYDRNKKRIYENDIVRHYNDLNDKDKFTVGVIVWSSEKCEFRRTTQNREEKTCKIANYCDYEVIGNTFDNAELLQ